MTEMTDEERKALDKKRKSLLERIDADAALWRTEALSSYAQVRDELRCVEGGPNADKKQFAVAQADLDSALVSMAPPEKCAGARTGLKQYYSGASIERTWAAIHRAGAALYGLYEINDLTAQGTRLCALLAALPGQNSQSILLNEALTNLKSGNAADKRQARSTLREIYQGAMGASDTLQMEARGLRNTLLVTSGALSLIIFILGFVHLFDSSMFSLCTTVEGAGKPICPAGGSSAHGFDVFAIELAGMLGGALSVVIPLATGGKIKTPYRVFNHQLLLKILAGGAAGLAGVILVESGFISVFSINSAVAIFGYAVFFGIAQQAVTGLVDKRASSLAKETPAAKNI